MHLQQQNEKIGRLKKLLALKTQQVYEQAQKLDEMELKLQDTQQQQVHVYILWSLSLLCMDTNYFPMLDPGIFQC